MQKAEKKCQTTTLIIFQPCMGTAAAAQWGGRFFPEGQEPGLCAYGSLLGGSKEICLITRHSLFFKEEEECLK